MPEKQEYILAAAIWYKDLPEQEHLSVLGIDRGLVLTGHRHGYVIQLCKTLTGKRTVRYGDDAVGETVQGFLTSHNRFVNRTEAAIIALAAKQIPFKIAQLFSEDLY